MDIQERAMQLTADDHHETGLLLRRVDVHEPNNHREGDMRLQSLRGKFHKDSSVQEDWKITLQNCMLVTVS